MEAEFEQFVEFLRSSGDADVESLNDEEARQYFVMTRDKFRGSDQEDESDSDKEGQAQAMEPRGTFEDQELEAEFSDFFRMLQQSSEDDEDIIGEAEARHDFLNAKKEWEAEMNQELASDGEHIGRLDAMNETPEEGTDSLPTMGRGRQSTKKNFTEIMDELKEEWGDDGFEVESFGWSEVDPDTEGGGDIKMNQSIHGGQGLQGLQWSWRGRKSGSQTGPVQGPVQELWKLLVIGKKTQQKSRSLLSRHKPSSHIFKPLKTYPTQLLTMLISRN